MRSPLPVVALAAAAALALTGCIGGQAPTPPVATIEQVDVPESMLVSTPGVTVGDRILLPAGSLPWLIGGAQSAPGKGGAPTVWTSEDGVAWSPVTVADDVDGSFSGVVGGSDELAALGGTLWVDGESTSVLWTSTDGRSWDERDLPDGFASDFRISDLAVTGSTVVAIATDVSGTARAVRVGHETATEFDLPAVDDDELLSAVRLVADGDDLLLVASPGPEGEPSPTASFVSDDGGDSWSAAAVITERPGFVTGVVAVEDGFVATGGAARDSASSASGAAAWFSSDGMSWAAESVPVSGDGPLFYAGSADAWLGAPLAGPAGVTAVFTNDNAAISGVYARSTGGAWQQIGSTGANPTNGLGGAAVSLDGATTVVLLGDSPYARLGTLAGGAWTETTTLAAREDLEATADLYPGEDRTLLTVSQGTFTVDADLGWSNTYAYQLGELDGSALAFAPWEPERAAALSSIALGSSDGAEVLLGSYFAPGTDVITVEGWFRADAEAQWLPVSGFPATGATSFQAVERVGDTWIAVGTTRASSAVGDPDHGVIWTSADGITWSAPGGAFGDGTLESSVVDVCVLPDGGPLAVGWVEESDSEFHTAAWTPGDGGWARLDIGDLGAAVGYATACASDDDGVILAATVSGRDTLQRSADGTGWDEVFRAERGISLGEPVAVPGGFAASGSLLNASFSGPVVWLSTDGVDWTALAIPSFAPGSTYEVAPYGDDLLVTMSSRIGHPVSIVRGIEKVVADTAG